MTRRMKKPAIIFFVALISSALLSSALAGCSKKPRSIFDYKDCVFSGTSGLLKTVEPEDNNGSSLCVRFYSAPKSGLCLYGDEQFKNQYEAWRFSDSGEILSHRVFRDNLEYEEYLKTIYKTEDSK